MGVQNPSFGAVTTTMGSRNRAVFVIDVREPLVVRVGEVTLKRGRFDARDGQYGERERVPAERVAVRADERAPLALDALDERAEVAGHLAVKTLARLEARRVRLRLARRAPAGRCSLRSPLRRHDPRG